jgi:peptidoglycan/LPS O-acetylase OafA/YrhL
LHFLGFFMMGAILAGHLERTANWYTRLPRAGRVASWIASVFLYDAGFVRQLPALPHIAGKLLFPGQGQELLTGAGGLLIVLFALQSALFKKLLRHTVIHHIGRVSYSLYLVHLPVLFTMVRLWPKINSVWLAAAIYICATSLLTESFYHLVEKPSMELGQRLAPRRRTAPINIATVST